MFVRPNQDKNLIPPYLSIMIINKYTYNNINKLITVCDVVTITLRWREILALIMSWSKQG